LLLVSSTKQNLQRVLWQEFNTTWQTKILKIMNSRTEGDHTAGQIFSTVNAQDLRYDQTKIHQIYRKFLTQLSAQNEGKTFSKL